MIHSLSSIEIRHDNSSGYLTLLDIDKKKSTLIRDNYKKIIHISLYINIKYINLYL